MKNNLHIIAKQHANQANRKFGITKSGEIIPVENYSGKFEIVVEPDTKYVKKAKNQHIDDVQRVEGEADKQPEP